MSDEIYFKKLEEGLLLNQKNLIEQKRRDHEMLVGGENGQVTYIDPFTVEI